ncbi:MAG: flagellar biosynthesis protein FlhA [Pseudomonadota bacterium]|nr:flagellar biosynthesis protein FlhA [Pseudomonadota bacterium]
MTTNISKFLLPGALLAVIIIMVMPLPSWVLDIGLSLSFALAILIFAVTLFIERPLDFSIFPTVLLATLMLRLSLNVSSTKLIIGQGHEGISAAGKVIEGFALFVMGGSIFLGLVVFLVLLIVNFVVITKGATRMAEVGARFALDGMPGKQLAIDSDMAAGAIDHETAKARRETELQETTFYGSLDGASKFVKGDAIAGLLITMLNLVMGLIMGVGVHGMEFGAAAETYAILTVGDSLVSQIPAVIVSIASALLLARGGAKGTTDSGIVEQLGRYPDALVLVSAFMAVLAFFPGMPFLPFLFGSGVVGVFAWLRKAAIRKESEQSLDVEEPSSEPPTKPLGDILDLDEIHIEFAPDLVPMALNADTGMDLRITNLRRHIATDFGFILPEIRLTDGLDLAPGTYVIYIQGVEVARGMLHADLVLALLPENQASLPDGQDVKEPVYGAPARWISREKQDVAALAGATIVVPTEVLTTHLMETIKANFSRLFTLKSLRRILDEMVQVSNPFRAEANKRLLDEMIPEKVQIDNLLPVLKLLLDEQVSIRNLPLILEALAEISQSRRSIDDQCEHVRQRLGFQIVSGLKRPDGTIPLIQLAPEWEDLFRAHQVSMDDASFNVALPKKEFDALTGNAASIVSDNQTNGISAAFVTNGKRRRFIRTVLSSKGINNPVLSFDELGVANKPYLVGTVAT